MAANFLLIIIIITIGIVLPPILDARYLLLFCEI